MGTRKTPQSARYDKRVWSEGDTGKAANGEERWNGNTRDANTRAAIENGASPHAEGSGPVKGRLSAARDGHKLASMRGPRAHEDAYPGLGGALSTSRSLGGEGCDSSRPREASEKAADPSARELRQKQVRWFSPCRCLD